MKDIIKWTIKYGVSISLRTDETGIEATISDRKSTTVLKNGWVVNLKEDILQVCKKMKSDRMEEDKAIAKRLASLTEDEKERISSLDARRIET